MIALTGRDLLDWNQATSRNWAKLLQAHPEALSLPCDVRETQTVAELLQHIVAVELRFAGQLHDLPETPQDGVTCRGLEQIVATHDRAIALMEDLQDREEGFWEEQVRFSTRSAGELQASRRTVLVHTLMHSIRHYAQLATLVRQHGIRPDWAMDFLFLRAEKA